MRHGQQTRHGPSYAAIECLLGYLVHSKRHRGVVAKDSIGALAKVPGMSSDSLALYV